LNPDFCWWHPGINILQKKIPSEFLMNSKDQDRLITSFPTINSISKTKALPLLTKVWNCPHSLSLSVPLKGLVDLKA
jgi:hypothetical protein